MIFEGELAPYFTAGMIEVRGRVFEFLHSLPSEMLEKLPRDSGALLTEKGAVSEEILRQQFDQAIV